METTVGVKETIAYLQSEAALRSMDIDPYWEKWNSPWWHMTTLFEMGLTKEIPKVAIDKMVAQLKTYYIKIFPINDGEMPKDADPYQHVMCHCALGTIYQILSTYGVDVDGELPWIRPWFLKYQMPDGGLNCDDSVYKLDHPPSSMVGTIPALEAILFHTPRPFTPAEIEFLDRGAACVLGRSLMFGSHPEEKLDEADWLKPCFPRFYLYDVLRGLSYIVRWAEKMERPLSSRVLFPVLKHLKTISPSGTIKTMRLSFEDISTTRTNEKGERLKRQPASYFPLLLEVSRLDQASPYLTNQWNETLSGLDRLNQKDLLS